MDCMFMGGQGNTEGVAVLVLKERSSKMQATTVVRGSPSGSTP